MRSLNRSEISDHFMLLICLILAASITDKLDKVRHTRSSGIQQACLHAERNTRFYKYAKKQIMAQWHLILRGDGYKPPNIHWEQKENTFQVVGNQMFILFHVLMLQYVGVPHTRWFGMENRITMDAG